MEITGYIQDPFNGKTIHLTTITRTKGDTINSDRTIGIRWLRRFLIAYKKEFSGFLRREYGFVSHKLKVGIIKSETP